MNDFYKKWKWTAIWQHILYGIPASITLAQAGIESAMGNSRLAREGNNFFGIKAYDNPYNLPVIYANDDLIGEPFIKYSDPRQSFIDHSLFLERYKRYDSLFNMTSYKDWADGLQAAGYATGSGYSALIKGVIEKDNLNQWDWIGKYKWEIGIGAVIVIGILIFILIKATRQK